MIDIKNRFFSTSLFLLSSLFKDKGYHSQNVYFKRTINYKKKAIIIDGRCFINESSSISVYLKNLLQALTKINDFSYYIIVNNDQYINIINNYNNIYLIKVNLKNNIIWDNIIIPFFALKTKSKIIFYPKSSSCWFRLPGKKIISTIHGIIYQAESEHFSLIERTYWMLVGRIATRKADKIIVVSKNDKDDIIQYLGCEEKKISIIPIGVNEDFLKKNNNANANIILERYNLKRNAYFIQIGTVNRKKNQLFTLKILTSHLKKYKNYRLVFVGPTDKDISYYKIIKKYIHANSLSENVIFTGEINQNECSDLLVVLAQNAFLGFFPSTYEGFGIPPLEMIASGIPVLISDKGALNEVYGSSNTLSLEDESSWKREIDKLFESKEYYRQTKQKQVTVLDKYKWNSIALEYLKLFETQFK